MLYEATPKLAWRCLIVVLIPIAVIGLYLIFGGEEIQNVVLNAISRPSPSPF